MPEYKARKVTLNETDNEDYTKRAEGEWQIVHVASGAVVMTIPWSTYEDASEYPERYFHDGPEAIQIDEARGEVVLIASADRPDHVERRKLPAR
ncbi:MAG: hypothetical protein H6737_21485 [Alphaproteobacteria bacterium]|nr:hypothetical protein [Alphaproteobacteria bacterium]